MIVTLARAPGPRWPSSLVHHLSAVSNHLRRRQSGAFVLLNTVYTRDSCVLLQYLDRKTGLHGAWGQVSWQAGTSRSHVIPQNGQRWETYCFSRTLRAATAATHHAVGRIAHHRLSRFLIPRVHSVAAEFKACLAPDAFFMIHRGIPGYEFSGDLKSHRDSPLSNHFLISASVGTLPSIFF